MAGLIFLVFFIFYSKAPWLNSDKHNKIDQFCKKKSQQKHRHGLINSQTQT